MRNGYVNAEQIDKARSIPVLEYLQRYEPNNLISTAPGEYRLKDHDSLKISNNKFNWFSRGIGGSNAIDYLVKVRGVEFKDAVRALVGDYTTIPYTADKPPPKLSKPPGDERIFTLPHANSHNSDVITYLAGRSIDSGIIYDCINRKLLYQNTKMACVFVGYNNQNAPAYACERGMQSDYKKDVPGSNKAYSFRMPPKTSDTHGQQACERLYVFEGAVDCLSHASIEAISGVDWNGHRLSLGGVSSKALNTFLESNPQIRSVYLCLNNDKPGKDATERICKELLDKYSHIQIYVAPPPIGNDYNDTLIHMAAITKEVKLVGKTVTADLPRNRRHEMTH